MFEIYPAKGYRVTSGLKFE